MRVTSNYLVETITELIGTEISFDVPLSSSGLDSIGATELSEQLS
jgi:hypothetical protein